MRSLQFGNHIKPHLSFSDYTVLWISLFSLCLEHISISLYSYEPLKISPSVMFKYELHHCRVFLHNSLIKNEKIFQLMLFLYASECDILQIGNLFTFSLAKHCLNFGIS